MFAVDEQRAFEINFLNKKLFIHPEGLARKLVRANARGYPVDLH